jgi:hypothetical protein
MAACPGLRTPTRARRHCASLVPACHLAPALSTARHLRSTRSPCSHHHHVRATPLSRVVATPRLVPLLFLDSRQASAHSAPPLTVLLCSNRRAPPLGAAAAASCTSVSSSTGGSLAKLDTTQKRPDATPHVVPLRKSCAACRQGPPRCQPAPVLLRPHLCRLEHRANAGQLFNIRVGALYLLSG